MQRTLKRKLAIGTTALAAVAFTGGALAASHDSPASARQAFLNDVAARLKVTPQQLTAALQGAFDDRLDAAVAAGKLTNAQAEAIKRRLQESGSAPLGGWGFFGAPGPGGPPGFGGPRPFGGPRLSGGPGTDGLSAAASYLGLSNAELLDQLSSGKSLAQLATSRGKSAAGLKAAMTAAARTKLDKALAAKLISPAQEQQLLSGLSARLDRDINRTGPADGLRRHGALRGYGWLGPRGSGPALPKGAGTDPGSPGWPPAGPAAVPAPPGSSGPAY